MPLPTKVILEPIIRNLYQFLRNRVIFCSKFLDRNCMQPFGGGIGFAYSAVYNAIIETTLYVSKRQSFYSSI